MTAYPNPLTPDLEAALAALHEASFGWARSCCGGNADDAADLLQTCYAKVVAGQAVFSGRSSFRTWLFGVIRLTALELRRRSARELAVTQWSQDTELAASADVEVVEAEQTATLREALRQLPDRQREVVHLVFYEGMSVADAAVVMELSVGSARVHYDRAKKRLRLLLAPHFTEDE